MKELGKDTITAENGICVLENQIERSSTHTQRSKQNKNPPHRQSWNKIKFKKRLGNHETQDKVQKLTSLNLAYKHQEILKAKGINVKNNN